MRPALVLVLLAAVTAVVACGSGPAQSPTGATTSSSGAATSPSAPAPDEAATSTAAAAPPATAARGVRLVQVGRFDAPVSLTAPPQDRRRVFVVQQNGKIKVMVDGRTRSRPFLDITGKVVSGGEQGLLGLAFPPDYATSKRFYVYYTAKGGGANTLVEYRATSADRADPASGRVLFAQPDTESNHNGGQLQFGPDGLLYVGLGDGGGANDQHGSRGNGQNTNVLLGKLLRIDPRQSGSQPYTIPSSNPFAGQSGKRGEIYSYGLRNPWRFSFDRATGDLAIADVGQNEVEEIDFARAGAASGANYGWRPFEGNRRNRGEPAPGAVAPVLTKTHAAGWCSITGGYIVRDPALKALDGRYVYGDYCLGQLRSVRLSAGKASGDRAIGGLARVSQLSSFGEDARGRVYVLSLDGPVYRFAAR
ncbi:MAG: glucose/sorbosone dehydrogenase-like protein [Solirubrobacterales bacterium]|nr:glucose/sorbosone dehydrogenase-like protein [Solirubrobacterales bacterium]